MSPVEKSAEIDAFIASYAQEATASIGLEASAASDAVAATHATDEIIRKRFLQAR